MAKKALPEHLRETVRIVAQHEMGHYVAAKVLGFSTGYVSIEARNPFDRSGETEMALMESLTSAAEVSSYLARRIKVLNAGAMAETLKQPDFEVDMDEAVKIMKHPQLGAQQDHAKIRELTHVLRNLRHPNTLDFAAIETELDVISNALWDETQELVNEHADSITGLAAYLAQVFENGSSKLDATDLDVLEGVIKLTNLGKSYLLEAKSGKTVDEQ